MGQHGYDIEFHDGQRNGVGQVLLGMPQNADWALVTCVSDKTCLRNALTYAIGRDMAVRRRPLGRRASAGPRSTSTAPTTASTRSPRSPRTTGSG